MDSTMSTNYRLHMKRPDTEFLFATLGPSTHLAIDHAVQGPKSQSRSKRFEGQNQLNMRLENPDRQKAR